MKATFRFYAELNDFLPTKRKGRDRVYHFDGKPSVKDAIEAQGVPHTEVDLILANGEAVSFGYHLFPGDRIAIYPVFETFDISRLVRLRDRPQQVPRFVLDVHLGRLARWLRLTGFDTLYRADLEDAQIAKLACLENRVVLTRDVGLLQRKAITHGYWVRAVDPDAQIVEVLRRFHLEYAVRTFERCLACNGEIRRVDKAHVRHRLEPNTRRCYDRFYQCANCKKVYWAGSHYARMVAKLKRVLGCESARVAGGPEGGQGLRTEEQSPEALRELLKAQTDLGAAVAAENVMAAKRVDWQPAPGPSPA